MQRWLGILLFFLLSACGKPAEQNLSQQKLIDIYQQLAAFYLAEGAYSLAREKLDALDQLAPNALNTMCLEAEYAQHTHQLSRANKKYQQALARYSNSFLLLNQYAIFLCQRGDRKTAGALFRRAMQVADSDEERVGAQHNLSVCLS